MEESEIAYFVNMLNERRAALLELKDTRDQAQSIVELDQSRVGRLSRMDALQQQAMARANQYNVEVALKRIDAALQRCQSGHFGICDECDEPINHKRLEFDPTVVKCIVCAQNAE